MPTESLGIDTRMAAMDMDPKGFSPMSGPDENMSSPPSVLTTASAGSTPSSIPSAGSTPSSVPSAGSTPYQYNTHEDGIKPTTPSSDHQPITPTTPDQPITPDHPQVPRSPMGFMDGVKDELALEKMEISTTNISDQHSHPSGSKSERRDDCSCILCEDHRRHANDSDRYTGEIKVKTKRKNDPNTQSKSRKRKQSGKNAIHYHSEISQDSELTGIRMKIKLTLPPHTDSNAQAAANATNLNQTASVKSSPVEKAVSKRKSLQGTDNMSNSKTSPGEGRKRRKASEFVEWGPILSEVKGEPQSPWAWKLPDIALFKIFDYAVCSAGTIPFILRASRVCRYWRKVATDKRLWHTVDLATGRIKPKMRNERKLLWILEHRLSRVQDLNLAGWNDAVTPPMLPRLVELCPELVSLNLSYCHKIHAENLHSHLSHCPKLERIDLTNVMASHKPTPRCAVGQQTLSDLAATMNTRLTHLILANNTLSNVPSLIRALAEHCPNLQTLDLSNVMTIGRDCVLINIELLQKGCAKMRNLRLTNCNTRLSQTSMSAQASAPGFPELEELSLAVDGNLFIGMNDSELERILKNSHKLRLLDVRGCMNITDSSLVRIPPWDLEHLFLAGSSNPKSYSDRLELVVRKWQHSLVELDLSWTANNESIDVALMAISEEADNKLRYLNMCGSSVTFNPIRQVLSRCKNLQTINLTSCRALPRGVKRLHEGPQLVTLRGDIDKGKFDETPDQDEDD